MLTLVVEAQARISSKTLDQAVSNEKQICMQAKQREILSLVLRNKEQRGYSASSMRQKAKTSGGIAAISTVAAVRETVGCQVLN